MQSSDRNNHQGRLGEDEPPAIEQHLRTNARRYCSPGTDLTEIRCLRFKQRAAARLYWYRIGCQSTFINLIVKVPEDPADIQATGEPGRCSAPSGSNDRPYQQTGSEAPGARGQVANPRWADLDGLGGDADLAPHAVAVALAGRRCASR